MPGERDRNQISLKIHLTLSTKMNSKLCLILFGALVALAALSAAEKTEENSLSEEITSSRLARAAEADPGKKKKSKKSKRNKNKASKNKSQKKSRKNKSKKKSKKAQKKKSRKARRKNKEKKLKGKNRKARRMNKKTGRKNKSKKNNSKKERQQGRDVPDTCLTTSVNILYNGLSKKASNFDRQEARVEARVPVIAKKLAKASEFNATLDYLKALNSSNCPSGDDTLLTALIATLGECETNIETACAKPMFNQTQIDECKPIVEGFVAEVEKCFDLNSDAAAACDCWESDAMA